MCSRISLLLALAMLLSCVVTTAFAATDPKTGVSYDPNKDYSIAISEAASRGEDTSKLEAERQAKINDKYNGNEPALSGTNGTVKFSDVYSGSSSGTKSSSGSSSGSSSKSGSSGSGTVVGGGVKNQDVSLSAAQCDAIMDSLASAGKGKISRSESDTVVGAIAGSNPASGKTKTADSDTVAKAQEIICKIYDNDATKFNQDVAKSIIDGTPGSVTTVRADGLVEMWEGGHLFIIDKSGDHWVVTEDKSRVQPGAINLTTDQVNQIFALKEEFAACQQAGDVAGWEAAHDKTEQLRNQIGYTGGTYGDMYSGIPSASGSSWSETIGGGGGHTPSPTPSSPYTPSKPTPSNPYTPSNPTPTPTPTTPKHDYYVVFTAVKGDVHGTITPSPSATVAAGSTQVVRVTPDNGYVVKSMIVGPDADNLYNVGSRTSYTIDNIQQDFFVFVEFCSSAKIKDATVTVVGPDGTTGAAAGKSPEMKSGYGITPVIKKIETENAVVDTVTAYNSATKKTYKMQLVSGKWVLPKNSASKTGARVDYLPASLADGTYTWKITITAHNKDNPADICEPLVVTAPYKIVGSMYEDDFTGSKN